MKTEIWKKISLKYYMITATGYTQAQLFFNRSVNDKLPTTTTTTTKKPKSPYYEYVYNKKLGHASILNTIKLQTNLNKTPIKIL